METFGKRWQLRLLAGLLAIFVTMYSASDLFGTVRAADDAIAVGESSEEDKDTVDEDEEQEAPADEEESGEEDEIMLLSDVNDKYFTVTNVHFTLNSSPVAPGQTVYVKNGDEVKFDFIWAIGNIDTGSGWTGSEVFEYTSFGDHLGDIRIPESKFLSGPLTVGSDASAHYEIETDPVTGKIGALKITISSKTGTFNHDGMIDLAGEVKFSDDGTDGHTLGLGSWSCTIKDKEAFPDLAISKWADGQIYYEGGAYYQNFTVRVNNSSEKIPATDVLLTDSYSDNFANQSLEFRGTTLNGKPVSNPVPDHDQNQTALSVGTIPAKGEYVLSYRLKVDKPGSSLAVYNSNFENTMSVSCEELENSLENTAWGSYAAPSFNKSGTYREDDTTPDPDDGWIDWKLTVNPGVFKDDPNLSFTVTDIPVQNITAAEISAALGGKTTLTKADFAGPDANGNYILPFTTKAPDKTAFEQKVTNKAELKIYDGKLQSSPDVKIPANDNAPTIDKKIDTPSPGAAGEVIIPWSFDVHIPEDIIDPDTQEVKEEVVRINIDDRSSTQDSYYGGQPDRIKILYNTLKLTAQDGTEYRPENPPQNDSDYSAGRNCKLVSGAGAESPFSLGLWFDQNLGFSITSNNGADLSAFKGKTFTVSYDMSVVSTADDIISKIENNANLTVTTRKKNGKEENTNRSDTEVYQKLFSVSKGEAYWPAGIDGANGQLSGKSGVKGWTVKITNNTIDTNSEIVLKDKLPEGYHWVEGAIQVEIADENDAVLAKLVSGSFEAKVAEADKYTYDASNGGVGNETLTVTINLSNDEFRKFTAGASLKISYCGYMDTLYMNSKTNSGNSTYVFTLRNEAEVAKDGEKANAVHTMWVTLPSNPSLVKEAPKNLQSQSADRKSFKASYVLKVNEGKAAQNEGEDITVTDKLGTKLKLVPNSIIVWEYAEDGSRTNVTNTVKPTVKEAAKDGDHTTLTFKLKDQTYYQIEYKVTGSELLDSMLLDPDFNQNDPEMLEKYLNALSDEEIDKLGEGQGRGKAIENLKKAMADELSNRYGNVATISGQTDYSDGITLNKSTFRLNTSYNFEFLITGKKIWPENDTPPDEIVLKLTTTETYVEPLAEQLGKKTNQTVTYYHLLLGNNAQKPDEIIDGNRHTYQNVTVDQTDNSWSFKSDFLKIEDMKGSKFVYTLEEEEVDGYFPTYIFDPDEGTGMTTTDGTKFQINGPINVEVENKRVNTTGTVKLLKTDDSAAKNPLIGAEFELTTIRDLLKDVTVTPSTAVVSKDSINTKLTLKITENTGIELSELPAGTYTLTETKAPDGYKLNNTPYQFRVRANGAIQAVSAGDYSFSGKGIPTISLRDASMEVSVNKVDMTSQKQLPGAELSIKNADGVNIEKADVTNADSVKKNGSEITFTTTKDTATIKGLPAGNYTLTEKVAPNGYAVTSEFKFTIGADGRVTKTSGADGDTLSNGTITLNDKLTEFTVEKTDEGDTTLLLGGAVFTVRAESNGADLTKAAAIAVADADYDPAKNTKNSITFTTQEGKAATIKGLPAGEYTLEETTPPEGYRKSASVQTFTIKPDGTIDGYTNNKITVENEIITADLTVKKVGEDRPNVQLSGAEFTITSKKSVDWTRVRFDGDPGTAKGTSNSFTTDGDDFKIEGLPVGDYELTESVAPTGYLPFDGKWSFKVKDDGTIISTGTVPTEVTYADGASPTVTVTDEKPDPGTIVIYKNDENGVRLAGAKIKLTVTSAGVDLPDDTITNAKGIADAELSADKKSLTFKTTADAARILNLPKGTYEVEELEAPSGYIRSTVKPLVVLDDTSGVVSVGSARIVNNATEISINKHDMTSGKQLPNAVLIIRNDDKNVSIENADVENADSVTKNGSEITFTTTKDTATIRKLPAGDYTLIETVAPNGYAVTSEFKFTIGADGRVTKTSGADSDTLSNGTITLNDELNEISITKVDMTSLNQLPGAELSIRNTDGVNIEDADITNADSVIKSGSTITFTTTKNIAAIKGLPSGTYTLEEIAAPDGYAPIKTTFTFTIDKYGKVTAPTNTTTPAGDPSVTLNGKIITVENAPLSTIRIVKKYIDENNHEIPATAALRGATSFGLFSDAKCANQIGAAVSPDANGEVIFSNLSNGTYYVKEIWSPEGYAKDEAVYECVISQGTVTYRKNGTAVSTPAYTNVSTTTAPTKVTSTEDSGSQTSGSQTSGSQTSGSQSSGSQSSGSQSSGSQSSGSQSSGTRPSGTQPTGPRPSGGTRPTSTTTPTIATTAPTTATTSGSTLTEPDETEPEKTTAKTTAKTKRTTKTTTVPKTDLPKTTTTTAGTERTDIAIGINEVTRDPGIGIDSNLTTAEENPNTGVSLAPLTSLTAVFAAAGTLAVVTRKKKKK